jgi:regulatory protein
VKEAAITDEPRQDAVDKARADALRILGRGDHAAAALIARLVRRGHAEEDATRAVERLRVEGWLDDEATARALAERTVRGAPAADRLIETRLRRGGVEADLAARVARETAGEDPVAAALLVAERRCRGLDRLDPAVAARRVAGVLARRGFDEDVIETVLSRLDLHPDQA